jgi:hypothetical protein
VLGRTKGEGGIKILHITAKFIFSSLWKSIIAFKDKNWNNESIEIHFLPGYWFKNIGKVKDFVFTKHSCQCLAI